LLRRAFSDTFSGGGLLLKRRRRREHVEAAQRRDLAVENNAEELTHQKLELHSPK
jgi:hypothetical protein